MRLFQFKKILFVFFTLPIDKNNDQSGCYFFKDDILNEKRNLSSEIFLMGGGGMWDKFPRSVYQRNMVGNILLKNTSDWA